MKKTYWSSILHDLHMQIFHYKYEIIKQWNVMLLKYREYKDNQGSSTWENWL